MAKRLQNHFVKIAVVADIKARRYILYNEEFYMIYKSRV